ncbi:MAG: DUF2058 domain-containing protein [Gammaproteobacteria bacterium]|nr:DUF2058 domain-containing protein [Gammaproteobacteria bacterium]
MIWAFQQTIEVQPLGNSFQDQLQKAGLVDEKKAEQVKKEKYKKQKQAKQKNTVNSRGHPYIEQSRYMARGPRGPA